MEMTKNTIYRSLLAIGLILLIGAAAFGTPLDSLKYPPLNEIKMPKIEKKTLANGIKLYLIEDNSLPTFDVLVRVNCGSYLELDDKIGLASMCGTVMRTGGTQKWSGDELDEMLEGIGGSVETSIGTVSGTARVSVLSDYIDLGLEALAQVLRYPIFDQDKIDLAKVQARTEISRRNDDPWPIVIREYKKLIYGDDSPYARQTEYATIDAIGRDDLVAYHDTYFHPENIQMAIWGDFKKKDLLKKIEKYFGDWQATGSKVTPPPKVDYKFVSKVYYIEKKDSPQANILMGHIGGYLLDDDYAARIVMNSILGGSFGSRLVDNVRSKEGLAYTTGGRYSANIEYPGMFYAYAFTKNETAGKAVQEMIHQIQSMQTDPPTDMEMRLGKDGYLNSFVFNFDTQSEVVSRMMNYDYYHLPEDLLFKQKDEVENVTAQDVIAAAKKDLHPDELQIVVLGNKDKFDMPLEDLGLGPVTQIDITIPSGEAKTELEVTPEKLDKGKLILDLAVKAHGGVDNFAKVKAVMRKGTYTINTPRGEFPLAIESLEQFPDKNRTVVNMMGQEVYDIRNGDTGWKTDQSGQLVEKTDEDIQNDREENSRSLLYIFKNADNDDFQAVYDGDGKVGDTAVEYVTLLDHDGEKICRLGFAKDTGMLAYKSFWGQSPLGEGNIEETYGNMKAFDGITIPLMTYRNLNGNPLGKIEITDYQINPTIPAGAFEKP
jgi:zinc protease